MSLIPHPDDPTPPEFDAPPPIPPGHKSLSAEQMRRLPVRPARAGVDNPSEKAIPGIMPVYHASAPTSGRRR